MKQIFSLFVSFVLFFQFCDRVSSQNGLCRKYQLVLEYARDCGTGLNLVQTSEIAATIDENCRLYPVGCGKVLQDLTTINLTYEVTKAPLFVYKGSENLCEKVKSLDKEYIDILTSFGIPVSCPVQAQTVCLKDSTKYVDLSRFAKYMDMVTGTPVNVKLNGQFQQGQTCFELQFKMNKSF